MANEPGFRVVGPGESGERLDGMTPPSKYPRATSVGFACFL